VQLGPSPLWCLTPHATSVARAAGSMVRAPAGSMVRGHVVRVTGDNRSFCGRAVRWVFDNLVLLLVFAVALYLIVHNGSAPPSAEIFPDLAHSTGSTPPVLDRRPFNQTAVCCLNKGGRRLGDVSWPAQPACVEVPCAVQTLAGKIGPTLGAPSKTAGEARYDRRDSAAIDTIARGIVSTLSYPPQAAGSTSRSP
jgi:hypothetical protein